MLFLHVAVSFGWIDNWFIGDISNAFLQGGSSRGKGTHVHEASQTRSERRPT